MEETTLHALPFLRSVTSVLGRVTDQDWDLDREMLGWGQRERPVLLPGDYYDWEGEISDA